MKQKGKRPKRTLRQRCFQLSMAGVASIGIAAIAYRRHVRLLAGLRRLRSAANNGNKVLMRPAQQLIKEANLITAVTKAGWPLDDACVGGVEETVPFLIVTLTTDERAKLCAADNGFVLQTLIDPMGTQYDRKSLPSELQAKNLSYDAFRRHTERAPLLTHITAPQATPV